MRLQRRLTLVTSTTEGVTMTPTLRVAFATRDRRSVDQHFGSALAFALYDIAPGASHLVEVCQFGESAQDGNEGKLSAKMDALQGCDAVYSAAVGGSAVAQLKARGVQAMKVDAGSEIAGLIAELQQELGKGIGWAAKAAARKQTSPGRFDEMEAEGWEE